MNLFPDPIIFVINTRTTILSIQGKPLFPNKREYDRSLLKRFIDLLLPIIATSNLYSVSIRDMLDKQQITLPEDIWDGALRELVRQLGEFGLKSQHAMVPMPMRRKRVEPLSGKELDAARYPFHFQETSFDFQAIQIPTLKKLTKLHASLLSDSR